MSLGIRHSPRKLWESPHSMLSLNNKFHPIFVLQKKLLEIIFLMLIVYFFLKISRKYFFCINSASKEIFEVALLRKEFQSVAILVPKKYFGGIVSWMQQRKVHHFIILFSLDFYSFRFIKSSFMQGKTIFRRENLSLFNKKSYLTFFSNRGKR